MPTGLKAARGRQAKLGRSPRANVGCASAKLFVPAQARANEVMEQERVVRCRVSGREAVQRPAAAGRLRRNDDRRDDGMEAIASG